MVVCACVVCMMAVCVCAISYMHMIKVAREQAEARLMEMGFTAVQAQAALVQHPANVEGALTWLLNRAARAKEARQAHICAASLSSERPWRLVPTTGSDSRSPATPRIPTSSR